VLFRSGIPVLQDYIFVPWFRVKGGVYSYIQKILDCFKGQIYLGVEHIKVSRPENSVNIELADGTIKTFDKVIFAVPPDQILNLLSDPTPEEVQRFGHWTGLESKTLIHTDDSMYQRYGVHSHSEFDFLQSDQGWGYNAWLNQLCGISSATQYNLAYNLDSLIAPATIIHTQFHLGSLHTVKAFAYREDIIQTNGEGNTYHVGAYLGDGLHEGATTSALRVASLIG